MWTLIFFIGILASINVASEDCVPTTEYLEFVEGFSESTSEAYDMCVSTYRWTAYWHRYDECVRGGEITNSEAGCGPIAEKARSDYQGMGFGVEICDALKEGTVPNQTLVEHSAKSIGIEKCNET